MTRPVAVGEIEPEDVDRRDELPENVGLAASGSNSADEFGSSHGPQDQRDLI